MHETGRIDSGFRRRRIIINIVALVLVALLAIPCYYTKQRYTSAYSRWHDCEMQLRVDAFDLQGLKDTPYQYLSDLRRQQMKDLTAETSALLSQRSSLRQQEHRWEILFTISIIGLGLAMLAGILARFSIARQERIALARVKSGCCTRCGYDLRGGGERCSECGTPHHFNPDRATP